MRFLSLLSFNSVLVVSLQAYKEGKKLGPNDFGRGRASGGAVPSHASAQRPPQEASEDGEASSSDMDSGESDGPALGRKRQRSKKSAPQPAARRPQHQQQPFPARGVDPASLLPSNESAMKAFDFQNARDTNGGVTAGRGQRGRRGGRGGRSDRGRGGGGRDSRAAGGRSAHSPYALPDEHLIKAGKRSSTMPRSGNRSATFK